MIRNEKELLSVLNNVLSLADYSKRDSTWYKNTPEVILVVNLQKSDFGGQYYINLGISFKAIQKEQYPQENKCHIRMRLDNLTPNRDETLNIFNLEKCSESQELLIIKVIQNVAVPWLEALITIEAIKSKIIAESNVSNRTTLEVKKYLGM